MSSLSCVVSLTHQSPGTRVSKGLVAAIRAAGLGVMLTQTRTRAHVTRGISALWALFAVVPPEDFL